MKKIIFALFCFSTLLLATTSCEKDDPYKTYNLTIQLVYPEKSTFNAQPIEGIVITATNSTSGIAYTANTDNKGTATLAVTAGLYEVSASDIRSTGGVMFAYNGTLSGVTITKEWEKTGTVQKMDLVESKASQIVIKEFYFAGCKKADNTTFYMDRYVTLYNNSNAPADLTNLCFAYAYPLNSNSDNKDITNGVLSFEATKQVPASGGYWTWTTKVPILQPGKEVTVAIFGAINNTTTYPNSVDLGKAEYYAMYDPTSPLVNALYYPAPSQNIPSSQYLKVYWWGTGNAWTLSNTSPALFVFRTEAPATPQSFFEDVSNENFYDGKTSNLYKRKLVPGDWVVDGVEIFNPDYATNYKRLPNFVDAGSVPQPKALGYTTYRNVNKAATEAIKENKDKIVYNYNMGIEGSTDPSGIDAEASLKKGARIIYMDTNNSTNDFHVRKKAAIKE